MHSTNEAHGNPYSRINNKEAQAIEDAFKEQNSLAKLDVVSSDYRNQWRYEVKEQNETDPEIRVFRNQEIEVLAAKWHRMLWSKRKHKSVKASGFNPVDILDFLGYILGLLHIDSLNGSFDRLKNVLSNPKEANKGDPQQWEQYKNSFYAWLGQENPDVVVANSLFFYEWMKERGIHFKNEIDFVHVGVLGRKILRTLTN